MKRFDVRLLTVIGLRALPRTVRPRVAGYPTTRVHVLTCTSAYVSVARGGHNVTLILWFRSLASW